MGAIQSWGISVCLAALAAGIAGILAPKGNLEKTYKFCIALFFLCSVLIPLFNLRHIHLPSISASSSEIGEAGFSQAVEEQTLAQVKQNLEDTVRSLCKTQGITPEAVEVTVNRNQEGAFDPQRVSILLSESDMGKKEAVISTVQNALGISVD
ncbi:MAG TPA: hypothetical protein DEP42_03010, partial [Ruminococcaceae bacterium]|nr:hypothetical protein [Oscillospiraceae bacterium]